jgi:hypothetical protein
MFNPQDLEMMVEGIQAERRNAAKMNRLAMASRSSGPRLHEKAYRFIISLARTVKGHLQVKADVPQAQGHAEIFVE